MTTPAAPGPTRLKRHAALTLGAEPASYVVTAGRLAVFALGLGGGLRRFLFHLAPGDALCGGAHEGRAHLELQAVAVEPATLEPIDPAAIAAPWSPELRARMDGWLRHLGAALAPLVPPADTPLVAGSGGLILDTGERAQFGGDRPRWLRISGGRIRLQGVPDLVLDADHSPLLLAPGMWLEAAEDDVTLAISPADEIDDGEAMMLSLQNLQGVLLPAFVALDAREQATSASRADQRERNDRLVTAAAVADLAALLDDDLAPAPSDDPPLLAAARLVAARLGVALSPPGASEDLGRLVDPLDAIARASGVRTRRVMLPAGWWREDAGPLVGQLAEGEHPVALLPEPGGGYACVDPAAGTRRPVDAALAAALAPAAATMYRPLPPGPVGAWAMARFALRGRGRDLGFALACGLGAAALALFAPQATGLLIDQAVPASERALAVQLALGLAATTVGAAMLHVAQGVALARLETLADAEAQAAVWDRVLALPAPFFRRATVGELHNRIHALAALRQELGGATLRAMVAGVFASVSLVLMAALSPPLTALALGLGGAAAAALALAAALKLRLGVAQRQADNAHQGVTLQLVSGVAKLRAAGAEARAFAHWAKHFRARQALAGRVKAIEGHVFVAHELLPPLCTLALFAAVAGRMAEGAPGALTTGAFLAFHAAFGAFVHGLADLGQALVGALDAVSHWRLARPVLAEAPEGGGERRDPGRLSGAWRLDHVTFAYGDGPPLLQDVSLHAEPGEHVALVGPSGSGKSTLFRLLLGFETPASGSVSYDGQELSRLDVRAVRRQLGVVLQHGKLQAGTIFENIACGALISHPEAMEAVEAAGLAADLAAMPMGLHTVLPEGGTTLSGGQRQRLLIARALVQRPRILLLDEATSALDNQAQALVGASLKRLRVTRVSIAHRLSTIRHADRIYVLEAGRVVQVGTFDELMAEEGLFKRLAGRQMA